MKLKKHKIFKIFNGIIYVQKIVIINNLMLNIKYFLLKFRELLFYQILKIILIQNSKKKSLILL